MLAVFKDTLIVPSPDPAAVVGVIVPIVKLAVLAAKYCATPPNVVQ